MGLLSNSVDAPLLPLWEKVPEGRMRGLSPLALLLPVEPLTRLGLRPIHPLLPGERGGSELAEISYGTI